MALSRWLIKEGDEYIINFGKYKGEELMSAIEDDYGYFKWIVDDADFDPELVDVIMLAMDDALEQGLVWDEM